MQSIVQSVFTVVAGIVATLMTVGLIGILALLATDRDSHPA